MDGSIQELAPATGSTFTDTFARLSTPSGYVLGNATIPETAGAAAALWTPAGDFSFVYFSFLRTISEMSLRDRQDGPGINFGGVSSYPTVFLGPTIYEIRDESGDGFSRPNVIVSHGDFVVIDESGTATSGLHGFFPGINPAFPDRAVPLLNIFPELATIDIDFISDLASVDGFLYMTLSGSDGTFLFGARDPSVIIPEPATVAMMFLGTLLCANRVRRTYALSDT